MRVDFICVRNGRVLWRQPTVVQYAEDEAIELVNRGLRGQLWLDAGYPQQQASLIFDSDQFDLGVARACGLA